MDTDTPQSPTSLSESERKEFGVILKKDAQASILRRLAGKDPETGKKLPVEQQSMTPNLKRAMQTAAASLKRDLAREGIDTTPPKNGYNPWTPQEEAKLLERYDEGDSINSMALQHGRSWNAIFSRLESLGRRPNRILTDPRAAQLPPEDASES